MISIGRRIGEGQALIDKPFILLGKKPNSLVPAPEQIAKADRSLR